MKYPLIYLLLMLGLACSSGGDKTPHRQGQTGSANETRTSPACPPIADSVFLQPAQAFPSNITDLDKAISPGLDSLLSYTPDSCLEKIPAYRIMLTVILTRLHAAHLHYSHTGLDLQSMDSGSAGVLVNSFIRMCGYQKPPEFFNSGMIKDFIDRDTSLAHHPMVKTERKNIEKEEAMVTEFLKHNQ